MVRIGINTMKNPQHSRVGPVGFIKEIKRWPLDLYLIDDGDQVWGDKCMEGSSPARCLHSDPVSSDLGEIDGGYYIVDMKKE